MTIEVKNLDKLLDGLYDKKLICFASIPLWDAFPNFSAMNICEKLHTRGKVLYISYEANIKFIEKEILKINSQTDFEAINLIEGECMMGIDKVIDIIENDNDIKYVIIDDLNCLMTTSRKEYSDITKKLKNYALKKKITIFTIFIMSRNLEKQIERGIIKKVGLVDLDKSGLSDSDFDSIVVAYKNDDIKYEVLK